MTTLRPYQQRNANEILALLQRRQNPLYVLPTGGGKTTVFCHVVGVTDALDWDVAVIVHRRELLEQASRALTRAGIAHGIVAPGHAVSSHRVHVASIDTILARLAAGDRDIAAWLTRLRLAVLDEAHHAVAGKWVRLAQAMPQAMLLGVTATPYRTDGLGLGDVFAHAVKGPSIGELIQMGYLAPPVAFAPPTALDLGSIKKRGGDWVQSELARLMDTDALIQPAVRHYARLCPGVPAVAFCAGVEHAAHVAECFSKAGWAAASVDGGMSQRDRDAAIQGLADGRLQVLTSCDLISEGTDIPVVGAAILLRPTESTGLFQQQGGRVLRLSPGKDEAIIIDLVRNTDTHGLLDEDRPWSLKGGIKGAERTVTATRRCRRCYHVHRWADACPRCAMAYPKTAPRPGMPDPKRVSGPGVGRLTADEVLGMPLKAVLDHAKTPADVRRIAEIRDYKSGWANRVIAEKFGIGQRRYGSGGWK